MRWAGFGTSMLVLLTVAACSAPKADGGGDRPVAPMPESARQHTTGTTRRMPRSSSSTP
jgi:hypothetical protein